MLHITIDVAEAAAEETVRERLDRACAGSALMVGALNRSGGTTWTAEIRAIDPRIVLGTASFLEVLHRVSRSVAISSAAITNGRRTAAA